MSMKTNYKPGDKIRVTKPGMFLGLEGKVETNNTATTFKPLLVDLNPNGSWSFNYEDIVSLGKENALDGLKTSSVGAVKEPTKKLLKKKPAKQKRKYNKKG